MTQFEWDPNKAQSNWRKHHVRFEEAQSVFDDPLVVTIPDPDHSEQEDRWLTIGMSILRRLLIVAHTQHLQHEQETIRIISAREAARYERRNYEEAENR